MSELGSFTQCMIDGDAEAIGRARRLRRKAFTASVAFECVLVVAMLLLPLITPGVLQKVYLVTPLPPYAAPSNAQPARQHAPSHPARGEALIVDRIYPTAPTTRRHVELGSTVAPDLGPASNSVGIPGNGPGIPFSTGSEAGPPPPVEHHEKPRLISRGAMEGSLIHRVDPVYPAIARNAHITGEVKIRATIGTDGVIHNWEVISGNPIFFTSTIAAIRQWRYRPTLLSGEPVEVETFITVKFIMD
ncbi:MAG TPA: energy transducer TonB [Candidatus Acidoferrales bacterium]|nr:energy transducer TonB [Candidatus Acidoferrales bacterium]